MDTGNPCVAGRWGCQKNETPHAQDVRRHASLEQSKNEVMIETKEGWKELPIVPANTLRYGGFTWRR